MPGRNRGRILGEPSAVIGFGGYVLTLPTINSFDLSTGSDLDRLGEALAV
jgi:hypothetical protein